MASKVAAPGFYRIRKREACLDAVFVTAMAFARSRALNDDAGHSGSRYGQGLRVESEYCVNMGGRFCHRFVVRWRQNRLPAGGN